VILFGSTKSAQTHLQAKADETKQEEHAAQGCTYTSVICGSGGSKTPSEVDYLSVSLGVTPRFFMTDKETSHQYRIIN
jgi:hypothetical protein